MLAVVTAMGWVDQGQFTRALPVLRQPAAQRGPLADYATYYAAMAEAALGRHADALRTFTALRQRPLVGYLKEAAALGAAEEHQSLNQPGEALAIYEGLAAGKSSAPDEILMRLAKAAYAAGRPQRAAEAFMRAYFEYPLGDLAPSAAAELAALPNVQPLEAGNPRYRFELGRAERLYGARRYGPARQAFEALRPVASEADRGLIQLRIAECHYFSKRLRNARDGLLPLTKGVERQGEALYFYALAVRDLGDHATYLAIIKRLVSEFPDERWAEESLNHLATHYILLDRDADADATLRDLLGRFPKSQYAARAAWKTGWRAYRQQDYADAIQIFERAAADFPRADYRPAWLYWTGRAYAALKNPALADERYMLAATDYLNSYYGRLSVAELGGRTPAPRVVSDQPAAGPPPPPNGPIVRMLLEHRRYEDARRELRYAQRVWTDSPAVQATLAYVNHADGLGKTGALRFALLRGAITMMRRAYPQFMAAGGEELPREILAVIFPLAYWDLIQKHAAARGLDPYLVAALVAQESTFSPEIRSAANATGLMQLMGPTARQYARKLGLRYSSALLTNPEANVRMGTAFFADLVKTFGSVHLALASYNAGERPVRRWMAERPGVPREEFIDDIPYPETQNYVKRILGTADDYRRLYGKPVSTAP
jgi:soluble lytic murein transglycosylase